MKTIDYSYFIERYNAGEMDQAEKMWFINELDGNSSLHKEVLLRKKADEILKRHDIISLRNKLVAIERVRREERAATVGKRVLGMRYAAVITGLVVIGSLLFVQYGKQSPQVLYSKYFNEYEVPAMSRSAGSEAITLFDKAIESISNNDFRSAAAYSGDFQKDNPDNSRSVESLFINGYSSMKMKNYPDAIAAFNKVIADKNNYFTENAQWYLALCYLGISDIGMAKKQLNTIKNSRSIYNHNAGKILRKL